MWNRIREIIKYKKDSLRHVTVPDEVLNHWHFQLKKEFYNRLVYGKSVDKWNVRPTKPTKTVDLRLISTISCVSVSFAVKSVRMSGSRSDYWTIGCADGTCVTMQATRRLVPTDGDILIPFHLLSWTMTYLSVLFLKNAWFEWNVMS